MNSREYFFDEIKYLLMNSDSGNEEDTTKLIDLIDYKNFLHKRDLSAGIKYLAQLINKNKSTFLHHLVARNKINLLFSLVGMGRANFCIADEFGDRPLHVAANSLIIDLPKPSQSSD